MPQNKDNGSLLEKSDLYTIIQVNNKAIEIQSEITSQYEEVIESLETVSDSNNKIVDKIAEIKLDHKDIKADIKEINKTQFKILVLLSAGVLNLIVQIISMLKK